MTGGAARAGAERLAADRGEDRSMAPTARRGKGANVLGRQTSIGNRAANTLVEAEVQRSSLTVGAVDDAAEREADRVAEQVMRVIASDPVAAGSPDRTVRRKEAAGADHGPAGGSVDPAVADQIGRLRGGGRPLEGGLRRRMEDGIGATFDSVRIHTDTTADRLSRSLNARAFTTGGDIFFARGEYDPASSAGQRLIAHELTHTVQQGAAGVQRTWSRIARASADGGARGGDGTIRREFRPATVTNNAHLRNDGQWGDKIGNRIDDGDEVVVDRTQTRDQTETHWFRSDTTTRWVKAVDGPAWDFDPAVAAGATTYLRGSSIGPDKDYGADGIKVDENSEHKPPSRRKAFRMRLRWAATIGEYVEFEESVSHDGAMIVHHGDEYRRLDGGQLHDLDAQEQLQLDTAATRTYLRDRVIALLRQENAGRPWEDLLATVANAEKIIAGSDAKALRIDETQDWTREQYVSWFRWATDPNGPLERIRQGAREVRDSLDYWRGQLYPPDSTQVGVSQLNLSGSDLHEFGLGVMFVTFTKPAGGHADYTAAGAHRVVVKPEARGLEQALFGTQAGSLANEINAAVGLAPDDQITTYKQQIHARYGTLCDMITATQAKDLGAPADVVSQAMKEALIFIMLTGLSDQHGENVPWDEDGKPYLIDADNALKLQYMTTDVDTTSMQNGFIAYAGPNSSDIMRDVMAGAVGYETQILEELQNPTSAASRRLLIKVRDIFANEAGRTVPIETAVWGGRLQSFIQCTSPGTPADAFVPGQSPTTRWQWCNYWASTVPTGVGANAPGLEGEVGMRHGTDGNFDAAEEARQLHADFTVGQIPFYNYSYGDGRIFHNNQHIWDGQPIGERMAGLFALFPNQDAV